MATQQDITDFVQRRFSAPPMGGSQLGRPPTTSAEACAAALVRDGEFRALQLGTWLNTPDADVIMAAVQAALPPPFSTEVRVIADGLKLAADMQRKEGLKVAGVVAGGGIAVFLVSFLGRRG